MCHNVLAQALHIWHFLSCHMLMADAHRQHTGRDGTATHALSVSSWLIAPVDRCLWSSYRTRQPANVTVEERFASTHSKQCYRSYTCTNTCYAHVHADVFFCLVMVRRLPYNVFQHFICLSNPIYKCERVKVWIHCMQNSFSSASFSSQWYQPVWPAETDNRGKWAASQKLSEKREKPEWGKTSVGVLWITHIIQHTEAEYNIL